MSSDRLLRTKLYIPPPRPNLVRRPRLSERLNEGIGHEQGFARKLTLVSAPAGFGKTTLIVDWGLGISQATASESATRRPKLCWLSLDEADNDPIRFLAYVVAALQTAVPHAAENVMAMLQAPQSPPLASILTALLNEITAVSHPIILVLDDYHALDAQPVDRALAFLLQHLPPQIHLVIVTREDPQLPLARLRARGQLTELRAADLRFSHSEAAEFLNQVMDLDLAAEEIAALESRTEGWIAGLHLAALALRGLTRPGESSPEAAQDAAVFIRSFTGSHRFVLDYLLEEVLHQQPKPIQTFLLRTSILERLCGPLCDAVTGSSGVSDWSVDGDPQATDNRVSNLQGQEILEYLERSNLFVIPLDEERRWYRYHHLFADLLRQRLQQAPPLFPPQRGGRKGGGIAELHIRASEWYEKNGLDLEAFHHAVAADDVERAARLLEGEKQPGVPGMPLHFRGAVAPILEWLQSLPETILDARPSLWVMYASVLSMNNQLNEVEEKLQAGEAALADAEPDDKTRNLIGHIAAIRALLAATRYDAETIITQSRRALKYLHPENTAVRTATVWKMGIAHHLRGDRAAAGQAYAEAMSSSEASGNIIINIAATTGLGQIQELENRLHLAAQTYQRVLQLAGELLQPSTCDAHLGLARISYQWNELDTAQEHAQQSLRLAQLVENTGQSVACKAFLARLKLAQDDLAGASTLLADANRTARRHNVVQQMPVITAARVRLLLQQDDLATAAELAEKHDLPLSQTRAHLAGGNPDEALATLDSWRRQVEAKKWADEQLEAMVLQTVALQAEGEKEKAVQLLGEALALAEPSGFIRLFVDEGPPMARLLYEALSREITPEYIQQLLAAFSAAGWETTAAAPSSSSGDAASAWIEPLSEREIEVLQLIAQGLTNQEIADRLYLSLHTIKTHARNIYAKLDVNNRTEAVAKGRALGILSTP